MTYSAKILRQLSTTKGIVIAIHAKGKDEASNRESLLEVGFEGC